MVGRCYIGHVPWPLWRRYTLVRPYRLARNTCHARRVAALAHLLGKCSRLEPCRLLRLRGLYGSGKIKGCQLEESTSHIEYQTYPYTYLLGIGPRHATLSPPFPPVHRHQPRRLKQANSTPTGDPSAYLDLIHIASTLLDPILSLSPEMTAGNQTSSHHPPSQSSGQGRSLRPCCLSRRDPASS